VGKPSVKTRWLAAAAVGRQPGRRKEGSPFLVTQTVSRGKGNDKESVPEHHRLKIKREKRWEKPVQGPIVFKTRSKGEKE